MMPPFLAQALVAAAAPPNDYESVVGDLHEEYVRLSRFSGQGAANRWYWSQVIRSIPSLLSYSRAQRSVGAAARTVLIVAAVLFVMMLAIEPINDLLRAIFGHQRSPVWALFAAALVRRRRVRRHTRVDYSIRRRSIGIHCRAALCRRHSYSDPSRLFIAPSTL